MSGRSWALVNQAYAGQRVSGQQRYAAEIAARVCDEPGVEAATPRGIWARSALWTWAWVQLVLPWRARSRVVLSMTARSPVWCRRQVLVVHDLFAIRHPEWFSRTYYWTHAPLQWLQVRTAARVVAVSRPVADEMARLGRPDVTVAPNAPAAVFSETDDAPSDVTTRHGLLPGGFLLAVGNREPRKNLARLATAYAALPGDVRAGLPLVLVGGGAAIYRDESIAWPPETVDAGYVDDLELRRLYRDAAAVVFVSLAEGFGLPLVEAVAAGARSLVVSEIEVFRWICGDGATYVDPLSVDSIAAGLLAQQEDDRPAPTVDLERFRWDTSAAVVAEACRAVAGQGAA